MKSTKALIPFIAAALSVGTTALGQINYVSRSSEVYAWADIGESDFDSDSVTSDNFLPFNEAASATAGNAQAIPFSYAEGTAYQLSSLSNGGFSYYGNLQTSAQEFGFSEATTYFSVTFSVDSEVAFSLSGGSAFGGGPQLQGRIARMDLENPYGISLTGGEFDLFWGMGEPVDVVGTLVPGVDYTLIADLGIVTSAFPLRSQVGGISPARAIFGASDSLESSLTLSLTSPVPEAGTSAAVAGLAGLALWQWRRRRA